ncbi:MAG: universal stress protein [Gordonia sp. (in: high G+C Gram-positive bacteria)]
MTVAVVFSESAEGAAALQSAVREARLRQTGLALLHATERDDVPDADEVDAVKAHASTALAGADVDWEVHVASRARNLAGAIVDLAVEVGADLLVIGTRRRSVTGKFLLGSVVQRVILDAPMEVLTVKVADD